jgi:CelD/BcsL family acetyltransferase involved in cellulose biosynthesis
VRIELHTTPSSFDDLAVEWNTLLPSFNPLAFFMRPDWQRIWWKHLQRGNLLILAVRDDANTLVGIAPFFVDTDPHGKVSIGVVGGIDVTDYVDLVCAPGCEQEVLGAIWQFLSSSDAPLWDSVRIFNVPQGSATLSILPELAAAAGYRTECVVEDVCPVLDLPGTYEGYLEQLDKKNRHELRRKRRRAETYPVDWYRVGPDHHLDEEIEAFLGLMALSTPDKAAFLEQPGHRAFFKEIGPAMFKQGLLDLTFLTVDGQRAAGLWNYTYGDRMMLYNSGLNPNAFSALSAGIVLLSFNIEYAIGRGFKKYDFLQGSEDYKYRMGAHDTAVYNLTIAR